MLRRDEGPGTLPRAIELDHMQFAAGSTLRSRSHCGRSQLLAGWALLQDGQTTLGLAFGGAVSRLSLKVAGGAGAAVQWQRTHVVAGGGPVRGLDGRRRLAAGGCRRSGRVLGASLDGESTLDAQFNAAWRVSPVFSLGLGWRFLRDRMNTSHGAQGLSRDRADIRMGGPQLSLQATF